MSKKIYLAEGITLLRESLAFVLDGCREWRVIGVLEEGSDVVDQLSGFADDVDLVLLDAELPWIDSFASAKRIRALFSHIKVMFLANSLSVEMKTEIRKVRPNGYISKFCGLHELVEGIDRVLFGEDVMEEGSAYMPEVSQNNQVLSNLTAQEKKIISYIALGETSKEIARKLCISPKTVDCHRRSIAKKTGLKNAALVTRFAIRHDLCRK